MRSVLDPPSNQALSAALSVLTEIGAIVPAGASGAAGGALKSKGAALDAGDEFELAPLGYHLALLPMDVRLGKALIVGAMLRQVRFVGEPSRVDLVPITGVSTLYLQLQLL
jgi:ATP-dependent RNA helicase DHX57